MSRLLVTRALVDALVSEVGSWGIRGAETGGFLLAPERQPGRASVLALAGGPGVVRRRDVFIVSGTAIERLFSWAADGELLIRAQVHSHARGAFLSPTDLRHGFDVDGFITAVVPNFAAPSAEPSHWGWWRRGEDQWRPVRAPDVVAGAVETVHFDEAGVHGA